MQRDVLTRIPSVEEEDLARSSNLKLSAMICESLKRLSTALKRTLNHKPSIINYCMAEGSHIEIYQ